MFKLKKDANNQLNEKKVIKHNNEFQYNIPK